MFMYQYSFGNIHLKNENIDFRTVGKKPGRGKFRQGKVRLGKALAGKIPAGKSPAGKIPAGKNPSAETAIGVSIHLHFVCETRKHNTI